MQPGGNGTEALYELGLIQRLGAYRSTVAVVNHNRGGVEQAVASVEAYDNGRQEIDTPASSCPPQHGSVGSVIRLVVRRGLEIPDGKVGQMVGQSCRPATLAIFHPSALAAVDKSCAALVCVGFKAGVVTPEVAPDYGTHSGSVYTYGVELPCIFKHSTRGILRIAGSDRALGTVLGGADEYS